VWKEHPKSKRRCFVASHFKVLRGSDGREAVVGVVKLDGTTLTIEGEEGKSVVLKEFPKGLKDRAGKKVIVFLKEMSDPQRTEPMLKVVSYLPFPM
jgi:hypothetical protein